MMPRCGTIASRILVFAGFFALGCAGEQSASRIGSTMKEADTAHRAASCDSARTQLEMTRCRADAATRAETAEAEQFTRVVQLISAKASAEQAQTLEAVELKWKAYRDAECRAVSNLYSGGSLALAVESDCRIRLANERAATLKTTYGEWGSK